MNWIKGAFVTGVELHRWPYVGALLGVGFGVGFIGGFWDAIYGTNLVPIAMLVAVYTSVVSTINRCRTVGVNAAWSILALIPLVSLVLAIVLLAKDAKKEA